MRLLPIAAQEAPTRAHFDRSAAFVLGSEQFKPLGDWKALYCQRNDPTACDLANIEVLASTCCKESLANGQVVVSFDYPIRPESRAYLFIKGLQTAVGFRKNAFEKPLSISETPISLDWGNDHVVMHREGLRLILAETGAVSARQSVVLFRDPEGKCEVFGPDSFLRVELFWMGDLDQDQKPDFLLYVSAYHSCARTILKGPEQQDPAILLILSTQAARGQLGKVIQPGDPRLRNP